LSLSASEKTIKSEEFSPISPLFEVENVLTDIGLRHLVEKAYLLD
jgi:hypothetical protein